MHDDLKMYTCLNNYFCIYKTTLIYPLMSRHALLKMYLKLKFTFLNPHNFLTVQDNKKKFTREHKNVLREMDFELLPNVFFVSLYKIFLKHTVNYTKHYKKGI
jgi:hypothetical protein